MMRKAVDEKITEQAAMCALGMSSQSETRAFRHYLNEGREDYAEELAAFDAVVTALALSAPERTPPELTRKRLLMTVAGEAETTEIPAPRNSPAPHFHNIKRAEWGIGSGE